MFSGIVEALGTISEIRSEPPGCRLIVREPRIAAETSVSDSICVNGCCLTVVAVDGDTLAFQAGPETLARTNLGELQSGSAVNLERSLPVNGRLSGHFVSGHIDGTGRLLERIDSGDWSTFWFSVPRELAQQMASKGSIAVDGDLMAVAIGCAEYRGGDDFYSTVYFAKTLEVPGIAPTHSAHHRFAPAHRHSAANAIARPLDAAWAV